MQNKEAPHVQRKRLLIMDDEPKIRDILIEMFRFLGYDVESAAEGNSALTLYENALTSGRRFDLVILDLTVKDGMGGLETMKRLQRADPLVLAVLSSGYAKDPAMVDFRSCGFAGAIAKPYSIRQLQEFLAGIFPRQQP